MANEWQNEHERAAAERLTGETASPRKPRGRWAAIAIPLGIAAVALLAGPPIIRATQEAMTPRLEKAADACNLMTLLIVGDEGKTLTLTTAGKSGKSASYTDIEDVACVLTELEVPSYVTSHIDSTRALDGQQTDEWDGISARWTFHPESGLHMVLRDG